jgi:mRNA-degrading endonuclease YafQ of YafQ-DinJ toxin-antitoxin module
MLELNKIELALRVSLNENNCNLIHLCKIQDYKAQAFMEKDPFHQAYANFYLASTFSDMGELSISRDLLKRIIPFFKEQNRKDYLQQALLLLSSNESLLGFDKSAVNYFDEAINLNLCLPEAKSRILFHFSNYFTKFSAFNRALRSSQTGLKHLSLKSKFQRKLYFKLLLQMAGILSHQKQFEKSLEILNKIHKAQKTEKLSGITALIHQQFAILFEKQNNFIKAKYHYEKAIDESLQKEDLLISLCLKVSLSNVFIKEGSITEAEALLIDTYNTYPYEVNEYFLLLISNLAEIYLLTGNKKAQLRFEQELCLRSN